MHTALTCTTAVGDTVHCEPTSESGDATVVAANTVTTRDVHTSATLPIVSAPWKLVLPVPLSAPPSHT